MSGDRFNLDLPEILDLGDLRAAPGASGEALKLDPKTIRASRWANRAEQSFDSPEFLELKTEIADAGGNVQPIKVRPLAVPDGVIRYEVVFGHRRHRACLDLGIDVAAVVEDVDDQNLWTQMERENRSRANLSAYEQGTMYQRALDAGLFPNMLSLAKAIGRDHGDVSKAIAIAGLPSPVVEAFASPADIRFRDSKPLKDAVAKAPEAVIAVAQAIATEPEKRPAAEVIQALTKAAEGDCGPSTMPPPATAPKAAKASTKPTGRDCGPSTMPLRWALDAKAGAMKEAKKGEWVRWADVEAALAAKGKNESGK
ncbi:ParB/RepB/Spo0J family partition protein [Azohydromonas aeria]|uniref:ParB/RepB/Spo0J family partition protein n=1 Tax=Azohydromonas aeria TaxID=2590212 RepID=UPI0012FB0B59|nr:ParB/RepB/Spo0J family partition protein [Azohydromonas aeria]